MAEKKMGQLAHRKPGQNFNRVLQNFIREGDQSRAKICKYHTNFLQQRI